VAWVFALDCILFVCLVLLLAPRLTGLPVHEWLGICVVVPTTVHLLLASGWIANAVGLFGAAKLRTRINFFLNLALLTFLALEVLSGVIISRVVLPRVGLMIVEDRAWRSLHNHTLNFLVLMLGVHLALNWTWLIGAVKRRWRGTPFAMPASIGQLLRVCSGLVIISAVITALAWSVVGTPSIRREYRQNEIGRFEPTISHGLIQCGGEAMLVGLVAWIARKWLRVRL